MDPLPISTDTEQIEHWLCRLREGDADARSKLIDYACERLRRLTRKLLAAYPTVQRWEQTDDVLQQALLRTYRALEHVQPPNVRAFMGLAATQIRRELIDLARHYYGPHGLGKNHATSDTDQNCSNTPPSAADCADDTSGPATLQLWTEFHQHVGELPGDEREVFDLLYYQGMSQADAAILLEVSERTVKRRWRTARLVLHEAIGQNLLG